MDGMELKDYINSYDININEMAYKCKTSTSSIYSYLNGTSPNLSTAALIEKFSEGKVTIKDLRGKKEYRRKDGS